MADQEVIDWEMLMSTEEAVLSDHIISAPLGVGVDVQVQEDNVINNNNRDYDYLIDLDDDDDRVVAVDLDRPSEEINNGTLIPSRFGRGRSYSRNARVKSNLVCQPRTPRVPIVAPPSPPPRVINPSMIRFLFKKQLHNSDVSAAGRIVIPKRVAELHLPALEAKEGTWLHLDDMDLFQVWPLKFRYWPNNSSRMYVFENTKDFVSAHGLEVDDFVMVYKDDETGSYVIRAKKSVVRPVMDIINAAVHNINSTTNLQNANNIIINNPAVNIEYGGNYWPLNYNGDGNNININNNLYGNPIIVDQFNGGSALWQPSGFGQVPVDQQFPTFGFDDFPQLLG